MGDLFQQQQTAEESVVVTTKSTFLMRRCNYCQQEWSPGTPAKHRPGCPNYYKVK